MNIHRCGNHRISCHFILLSITMTTTFILIITLLYYFTSVKAYPNDLAYSLAEPIKMRNGSGIVFPFEKDLWMNESSITPCPKFHFSCNGSKVCLDLDKRCNGKVDCPNAEDELNCVCAFRLPPAKFCDKYPDCFDESDESFCAYCPEKSFNCGNGKCIPRHKVCDTNPDCDNFMDENFCFRLSSNMAITSSDDNAPTDSEIDSLKTGYLLRNKNGVWFPLCANPQDAMEDSLASFACVSITSNPMASGVHEYKRFSSLPKNFPGDFIYHFQGRFVQWRGCLTDSGLYLSCDDVRCGFNPHLLLPKKPRGRIVGGELSQPGAWPWHAAIYKNGTYSCGATLINDRWLISAAHCFMDHKNNYFEIQLGMLRRRSFTPHQRTYRIDRIVLHPTFNIMTLECDIMMMRTSQKVTFDFWVRPICLPNPVKVETSGTFCTAIGWGDTGEFADDSDSLLEVQVPLTKACRRNQERWLCAGFAEGGRDACQGDSGGPLMCLHENRLSWYIAGVISGGNGCARPKTAGMYTRVVYFLDWIKEVMRSRTDGNSPPLSICPGWRCSVLGGGNCLRTERVCDGQVDCYDAMDEVDCFEGKKKQ